MPGAPTGVSDDAVLLAQPVGAADAVPFACQGVTPMLLLAYDGAGEAVGPSWHVSVHADDAADAEAVTGCGRGCGYGCGRGSRDPDTVTVAVAVVVLVSVVVESSTVVVPPTCVVVVAFASATGACASGPADDVVAFMPTAALVPSGAGLERDGYGSSVMGNGGGGGGGDGGTASPVEPLPAAPVLVLVLVIVVTGSMVKHVVGGP